MDSGLHRTRGRLDAVSVGHLDTGPQWPPMGCLYDDHVGLGLLRIDLRCC